MRSALELKSLELATLLNVRPETISRWENGKGKIDRAAWVVVADMVDDRLNNRLTTVNRLLAAANPKPPSGVVRLEVPLMRGQTRVPSPPIHPAKAALALRRSKRRRRPSS
jgi:hypothetical protein